jgi:hypothetical protein
MQQCKRSEIVKEPNATTWALVGFSDRYRFLTGGCLINQWEGGQALSNRRLLLEMPEEAGIRTHYEAWWTVGARLQVLELRSPLADGNQLVNAYRPVALGIRESGVRLWRLSTSKLKNCLIPQIMYRNGLLKVLLCLNVLSKEKSSRDLLS